MKYKVVSAAVFLLGCFTICFAHTTDLSYKIQRAIVQNQIVHESMVNVTATFRKPIKMSDLMYRPTRGCKDQVVSYTEKINTCNGVLSKSGKHVYVTTDCVFDAGYTLSAVSLRFSNGKRAKGTGRTVSIQGDVAYILVNEKVTRGLHGLPVSVILSK